MSVQYRLEGRGIDKAVTVFAHTSEKNDDVTEVQLNLVDPELKLNGITYNVPFIFAKLYPETNHVGTRVSADLQYVRRKDEWEGLTHSAWEKLNEAVKDLVLHLHQHGVLEQMQLRGDQSGLRSEVQRKQKELMRINDEYLTAIGELIEHVGDHGNLTGESMEFPLWTVV